MCTYEALGTEIYCEDSGWPNNVDTEAKSLEECEELCDMNDECTSILTYNYAGFDCLLHISSCDSPAWDTLNAEDGATYYKKVCINSTGKICQVLVHCKGFGSFIWFNPEKFGFLHIIPCLLESREGCAMSYMGKCSAVLPNKKPDSLIEVILSYYFY